MRNIDWKLIGQLVLVSAPAVLFALVVAILVL